LIRDNASKLSLLQHHNPVPAEKYEHTVSAEGNPADDVVGEAVAGGAFLR